MNLVSLKTVLAVQRAGSIVSAAQALNLDPSNVSRTVSAVEAAVGLRIFERTTRSLRITEAGARYLARVAPLLDDLDAAQEEAQRMAVAPQGHLRMTASVAFAIERIVPLLPAFHAAYPDVTVELIPADANLGLLDQGLDLAVRLAAAPKGDLMSTRLMRTRYHVVASPGYLATAGAIDHPRALTGRNCLRFALPDFRSRWLFRQSAQDDVLEVEVGGRTLISNALALRDAARAGMGPVLLADWLIDRDLRAGTLVDALPDWDCTATQFDTGAFILYPSRAYLPRKTRAMIDFLKAELG
ncbi:LysR family transcriptional regulator [Sulfitobacter sp. S190]|uniref:LysR family transcriptional regulator n=1 Tax=Sulfitobacter sp. S190 TaxID=2867022 RepID=UPI0021A9727E|nr:LysR family transcriptional regulator [Sulfitobacter sp. S190]UWR21764.1 LysR family transcriptional regulator [Sulfitobacter sp. S190]